MRVSLFVLLVGCDAKVVFGDGCEPTDWFRDDDRDGFGVASAVERACALPDGFVAVAGDCDDADAQVNPTGVERCNGVDDDCDGALDDSAVDATAWYPDRDGDGDGEPIAPYLGCTSPAVDYVDNDDDCDDTDADISTGAVEVCGGGDEDCDGLVDDADPDRTGPTSTFYVDGDGDGYGAGAPVEACVAPADHVESETDCDDLDPGVHPGALEVAFTEVDEDCDGVVDTTEFSFGTGLSWFGPSTPELTDGGGDFQLYVAAMEFDQVGLPLEQHEELAGVMLSFPRTAAGPAAPDRVDGRNWLRVFPPDATQVLSPVVDLAEDSTPGASACTSSIGVGTVCDWVLAVGADGVDGEINSALLYDIGGSVAALPRARGRGTDPQSPVAGDLASLERAGSDEAVAVQCGPEGLLGKWSDDVSTYQSSEIDALGGDVCFFHDDPSWVAEPEVEVCAAGDCFLVRFFTDGLERSFVRTADLPTEHWRWGDREEGRTLLIDPTGAAFVRADGSTFTTPVFTGESMLRFDLAPYGSGFVAAGITTDGRVLLEHQDGVGGLVQDTFPAEDVSNPTFEPSGVAVVVGADRAGVAVTWTEPGTDWPRGGSVSWTFVGLP